MSPDDGFGQAEDFADSAHFIFEKIAEGFDEVEAELFGEAADVVVQFDIGGCAGVAVAGFDDVGIEGALGEKLRALDGLGFALEGFDEFAADYFALLLGVGDAAEIAQEIFSRIVHAEVDFEVVAEGGFDKLLFVFRGDCLLLALFDGLAVGRGGHLVHDVVADLGFLERVVGLFAGGRNQRQCAENDHEREPVKTHGFISSGKAYRIQFCHANHSAADRLQHLYNFCLVWHLRYRNKPLLLVIVAVG